MMSRMVAMAVSAAIFGLVVGHHAVWAESEKAEQAELAKALKDAKLTLENGLKASEREGKPISAKFEVEHGKLQFSAYTLKGNDFMEVVANPQSGAVEEAKKITDAEDLAAAKSQKDAMDKAKASLLAVTEKAVKANDGFRAASIFPSLKGGQPMAEVTLLKGDAFKTVSEKLD